MKGTRHKNRKGGDWLGMVWDGGGVQCMHDACLLETKVQNNGAVLEKDNGSDR